ncbi:hypothetical protein RCC89_14215 [Cytophagaceae bacterium ABcell3]|nr:hypothetical protein RCC89_14215 [Cytophagaceae bacterium ABcell3]
MKIRFLLFLSLVLPIASVNAGILTLTGVYQGKNLYVQNPFTGNMKDFCTNDVYINDVKVLSNVQSSAYEIDLSILGIDDPVTVKITHKDDCKPKILNPQVVKSTSSFQFHSFNVEKENIVWATKGETPKGRFFVEQFKNNSWGTVKELTGKSSKVINNYQIGSSSHHSGLNKYRIKYLEADGQVFYSQVMEFESGLEAISMYPKRVTDKVYLKPRAAEYEVLNQYGDVISKGFGKEIDLSKAAQGVYYLNVDNQTIKFFKK